MQNYEVIKKLTDKIRKQPLAELFSKEDNNHFNHRYNHYSVTLEGLTFDYSKNYINQEILEAFIREAKDINLERARNQMFNGEIINFTEKRAVLHTVLRNLSNQPVIVNGKDYQPEITDTLNRMLQFAEEIRNGQKRGSSGKAFTDIVNIGIGGSSLPVQMAYHALLPYKDPNIRVHFVSNVDYANLYEVLNLCNPATTLFLVASKTFTTQETMQNANSAKKWLIREQGEEAVASQFVALSTNLQEVSKFGIQKEHIFGFWDFVGGRYSLWSAVGLAIAIAIGKDQFLRLLKGAHTADRHFKNAPLEKNIPFIMGVLSVLYRNFFDYNAYAVLPYSYYLQYFPSYLQQVAMESNGKTVNKNGQLTTLKTEPVLFGGIGTDAQHSFYQLLHQGSDIIPVDLIGVVEPHPNVMDYEHHNILTANLIAQAEAFMVGKSEEQVKTELEAQGAMDFEIQRLLPHKVFKGNRPSNVIMLEELSPYYLGMLCALYEHKIFIEGIFWNINSFDQWGVELGKELAKVVLTDLEEERISRHDTSTTSLIQYYKHYKPK